MVRTVAQISPSNFGHFSFPLWKAHSFSFPKQNVYSRSFLPLSERFLPLVNFLRFSLRSIIPLLRWWIQFPAVHEGIDLCPQQRITPKRLQLEHSFEKFRPLQLWLLGVSKRHIPIMHCMPTKDLGRWSCGCNAFLRNIFPLSVACHPKKHLGRAVVVARRC